MALATLLSAILLARGVLAWDSGHRDVRTEHLHRRSAIVYDGNIADTYDFVIAGGGTAGLALAARLSEDAGTSVLVLEAGDTGDAVKSSIGLSSRSITARIPRADCRIDVPGNAYYSSLLGTSYDWQYTTVPQAHAGGRSIPWARGKVLGGSSAVNGLYMVRPSALEVDAWAALAGSSASGSVHADTWTWAGGFFAAMKKSESFHAPTSDIATEGDIEFNPASHGAGGPVSVSYPGYVCSNGLCDVADMFRRYILPVVGNWTTTLEWIGIPNNTDANNGNGWGGYVISGSAFHAELTTAQVHRHLGDPAGELDALVLARGVHRPPPTAPEPVHPPERDRHARALRLQFHHEPDRDGRRVRRVRERAAHDGHRAQGGHPLWRRDRLAADAHAVRHRACGCAEGGRRECAPGPSGRRPASAGSYLD
jgi:choline dehydrogenase